MSGITYESIRSIISNSKLAVIHCSPEVILRLLADDLYDVKYRVSPKKGSFL